MLQLTLTLCHYLSPKTSRPREVYVHRPTGGGRSPPEARPRPWADRPAQAKPSRAPPSVTDKWAVWTDGSESGTYGQLGGHRRVQERRELPAPVPGLRSAAGPGVWPPCLPAFRPCWSAWLSCRLAV